MPSSSPRQHNLMEAVKHDPKFAKKVGIPQSVGTEYADADEAAGKYGAKKTNRQLAKRVIGQQD